MVIHRQILLGGPEKSVKKKKKKPTKRPLQAGQTVRDVSAQSQRDDGHLRKSPECLGGSQSPQEVSRNVDLAEGVDKRQVEQPVLCQEDGQRPDQLSSRPLPSGGEFEHGAIPGGSGLVLLPAPSVTSSADAAGNKAVLARVEVPRSFIIQTSLSSRSCVPHGRLCSKEGQEAAGFNDALGHGGLSASRRAEQDTGGRSGPTSDWEQAPPMVAGIAPPRGRPDVESSRVRRDGHFRFGGAARLDGGHLSRDPVRRQEETGTSLQRAVHRRESTDGTSSQTLQRDKLGTSPCLLTDFGMRELQGTFN